MIFGGIFGIVPENLGSFQILFGFLLLVFGLIITSSKRLLS
jgi:hypothetical protein